MQAALKKMEISRMWRRCLLSGVTVWLVSTVPAGAFVAYVELFGRFVGRGFRIPQLVNSVQSGAAAYARLSRYRAVSGARNAGRPK